MDKMKFETSNLTAANIEKLAKLFPEVVAEGKVNFDLLRTLLGDEVFGDEAYEFTWVGKREAIAEAGRPIRKTLRPCMEEGKNWDTTENLYIEGDNLEVLKLLQESYLGKVKMIYIDPPYNTGNDFVYRDNFTTSREEYEEDAGVFDEEGDRLIKNTDANGRFHSDWCSMLYPRLVLARNILSENGMIVISIDDNEHSNLKLICDEVFGRDNYISSFVWKRRVPSALSGTNWSVDHEYVLAYRKTSLGDFRGVDKNYDKYSNPDNDPRGDWMADNLTVGMTATQRPNQAYDIVDPKTGNIYPYNPNRVWAFIPSSMNEMISDNRIVFPSTISQRPMQKRFKSELKKENNPFSTLLINEVGLNREATQQMQELMGHNFFSYSKPLSLLNLLIKQICIDTDDLVVDFFSGSATTAHSVMQLNAEDGGKRKFIMVQLPEKTDEKSEAYKAGYKNICEIGKERIRRAGEKIKAEIEEGNMQVKLGEEPKVVPDIGFRVLKCDDTNMTDVYYAATDYTQDLLSGLESNIKPDRTDLDLLYACLLDWGLPLNMPHTHEQINGFTVHTYNDGDLIACFAEQVSEATIREIAKRKPLRAVFRDSSFDNSPGKINVIEIFKLLSPTTSVKVI